MAKQRDSNDNAINNLQNELDRQFQILEQEFNEAYKENKQLISEYNKKQDQIADMFSNPELDRQAEEELALLAQEMGIKYENEKPSVSSVQDDEIEKEYQKLLKEVESEQQNKQPSEPIHNFTQGRISDISTIVRAHGSLAEELANQSTIPEERSQLEQFSQDAQKLTKILDTHQENTTNQPEELTQKKISTISTAVQKIYSTLKSGISKGIDIMKGLGAKLTKGIKSLFSQSPPEQTQAFAQTINETAKTIKNIKNPSAKLQQNNKELLDSVKKLQTQFVKILPENKKAAFAKRRANMPIEAMSRKELREETIKIVKSLKTQAARNTKARKEEYNNKVKDIRAQRKTGPSR